MADVYPPLPRIQMESHCNSLKKYEELYKESIENPITFWHEIAKEFTWKVLPSKEHFLNYNFDVTKGPISIEWMKDGTTNMCYNALDRHLIKNGDKIAFHWEGNHVNDEGQLTYKELHTEVCKFANVLKNKGISKGDCVAIYMPMIIEFVIAMLACSRIGAIHSIIFGGYSSESLAHRIKDAQAKLLITADGSWRGEKLISLLNVSYGAIKLTHKTIETCIIVSHLPRLSSGDHSTERHSLWEDQRDYFWHELMKEASSDCNVEWMSAEDPLFLLYTSGSTGQPKGVLHSTAGYMLYTATTFRYTFDYQENDIYWCTADIGWITGHSYVVYGPLLNAATSVIFEGTPFYPNNDRYWQIIQKYSVTKFYTAPTAIRALIKFGEDFTKKFNLSSLKVLGTVGEPINPEAWLWYHKYVGNENCSIVDTYWQTETGGHIITPLPGCTATKPGSAWGPFFGVLPVILNEKGEELNGKCKGYIAFKQPWPGIMRTVYGNHKRFEETYFQRFPGYYICGDGASRDEDGYIWITGRIDDMINCSGHLMSTAQVESVLVEHKDIVEAAVVSIPHSIKGESLYCFVVPMNERSLNYNVIKELKDSVKERIASFAVPDYIQEASDLPKTRSGKILRRILRKIASNEIISDDLSTIADPSIITLLQKGRLHTC